MKWNIYHPTTFLPLAMILVFSCQSKVQEDNTAYERFKLKKLKEKDSTFIQENSVAHHEKNSDTTIAKPSQGKVTTVTAMAKVSRTTSAMESDAIHDYNEPSAETPKVLKATVIRENSVAEEHSSKKGMKQKKHIEWPKINKINLKKKKKQKGTEEVG